MIELLFFNHRFIPIARINLTTQFDFKKVLMLLIEVYANCAANNNAPIPINNPT